jgi:hypothetical protein
MGRPLCDLDGLVRELENRADRVESIGDQLVRAAANAIWTSVAADAFRAQVSRRRRDCFEIAVMLRAAASSARHFAADVEAEKSRLRRLEHEAIRNAERGARRVASWVGGL